MSIIDQEGRARRASQFPLTPFQVGERLSAGRESQIYAKPEVCTIAIGAGSDQMYSMAVHTLYGQKISHYYNFNTIDQLTLAVNAAVAEFVNAPDGTNKAHIDETGRQARYIRTPPVSVAESVRVSS